MARSIIPPTVSPLERRLSASPLALFDREFGRLARELRGGGWPVMREETGEFLRPQMNISETEKDYSITVDLPGVNPSDLEVTVDGDILSIKATRSAEKREEKENYHVLERQFGTFQRMIQLPIQVDPAQISADFDKGVLKLSVPKSATSERARKVEVRSGEGAGASQPAMPAPDSAPQPTQHAEGQAPTAH